MNDWPGPLFYPPVGKVAVMEGGSKIEVWPNESREGCFTGSILPPEAPDISCMWDLARIVRVDDLA